MEAKVTFVIHYQPVNPHIQTLKIAPRYFKSTFDQIKNQEQVQRSEGLRVICAGLPRTGTLSLKAALTSLLGGRCYHGFDTLFGSQEDVDFWVRVARDEAEDEEVREFFCARGITAAADFPAALYFRKLVKVDTIVSSVLDNYCVPSLLCQVFPNAKVILTSRSAESWQKSMRETLYLANLNRTRARGGGLCS